MSTSEQTLTLVAPNRVYFPSHIAANEDSSRLLVTVGRHVTTQPEAKFESCEPVGLIGQDGHDLPFALCQLQGNFFNNATTIMNSIGV